MERYEGIKEKQYREKLYFRDNNIKYLIEKKKGDKWKICIGDLTYQEARYLINNPTIIESKTKAFKITGYCILIFIIMSVLYFILKN